MTISKKTLKAKKEIDKRARIVKNKNGETLNKKRIELMKACDEHLEQEAKKIRKSIPKVKEGGTFEWDTETFTQADKVEDCKTVVGLFAITLLGVWVWWLILPR